MYHCTSLHIIAHHCTLSQTFTNQLSRLAACNDFAFWKWSRSANSESKSSKTLIQYSQVFWSSAVATLPIQPAFTSSRLQDAEFCTDLLQCGTLGDTQKLIIVRLSSCHSLDLGRTWKNFVQLGIVCPWEGSRREFASRYCESFKRKVTSKSCDSNWKAASASAIVYVSGRRSVLGSFISHQQMIEQDKCHLSFGVADEQGVIMAKLRWSSSLPFRQDTGWKRGELLGQTFEIPKLPAVHDWRQRRSNKPLPNTGKRTRRWLQSSKPSQFEK